MSSKTLAELGFSASGGDLSKDPELTGICVDSRECKDGFLFAAMPGSIRHGAVFIPYVLRMGAAAILTDQEGYDLAQEFDGAMALPIVISADPRADLSRAAAIFHPGQPEKMVAVTGTNGKTSVSHFTRQIWQALGLSAVNFGTAGVDGAVHAPLKHTTPEPITLHRLLSDLQSENVTHAAMEASSHGLEQRRLDGVRLCAGAFTNFTQDHLDYHETFEAYFAAKMRLFDRLLPAGATAVINIDDAKGAEVVKIAENRKLKVVTIGTGKGDLSIENRRYDATGQDLRFRWQGAIHQVRLNLIGGFQAENVLVAAALAIGSGCEASDVFGVLDQLETVTGRMELVATRQNGASVFVDYAHTPDAVKTALKALRPHVFGRLIVAVGAGGDRDKTKRPLMGKAAAEFADVVIVTDDNPRTEDPAEIRAEVMAGCPEATEIGDRAEAILTGVDALQKGDAFLIAGKGHETGQTIGETVYPFNDGEQASVAVKALDGLRV